MSRVPTVRKADLDRVLKALKAAGQVAACVVVRPGGDVVITPAPADQPRAALTVVSADGQPDNLDSWRARKDGRREA